MSDFGVVIPPNPGDANYEPRRAVEQRVHPCHYEPCCGETGPLCRNAPETPHAPRSAPGTPQRGSMGGGDGSDALRGAALRTELARLLSSFSRGRTISDVEAVEVLMPLIDWYGDQRAAEARAESVDRIRELERLASDAAQHGALIHQRARLALANSPSFGPPSADEIGKRP